MNTPPTAMRTEPPTARRPWRDACAWLAVVGALFFVTYGFANWFTARRTGVPSLAFDWERHIPFWPWTIVPYWSIDLLYVVSVFLCRERAELRTHALRLATITLVSFAGFMLFPLRFSFTRPETGGLFGMLFDALTSFDLPYNQAPSLHIGLLWIIALRFAAHTPPRRRWLVHAWATLIAISVLTTWQHHFIDVVTGFAAGAGVAYALPSPGRRWHKPRRPSQRARTIGLRYLVGAIAAALPIAVFTSAWWGWLLLWPALACALVASAYFGLGPAVFQKNTSGETAPSAAILLAPVRLGAWISLKLRARRLPAVSLVTRDLAIGARPPKKLEGIGAVLDLTAEFSKPPGPGDAPYATVPMLDMTPPTPGELDDAVAALRSLRSRNAGRVMFVHCALGLSRSAVTAAAWLLETGAAATIEDAVAQIRAARPPVVLYPGHLAVLRQWKDAHTAGFAGSTF